MKKSPSKAAEVKKVAKAEKKNNLISEVEVKQFVDNRPFEMIVSYAAQKQWDAPTFDQDTTDALALCYESFKARFSAPGAETVYRGVSAAQWCADRINKAEDKNTAALTIAEKVQALKDDLYSPILTAKTNRKKHITRDQAIKTSLDLMMQAA